MTEARPSDSTEPRPRGATAAEEKKKRPIWPWLLLAALIAALLLWWLIAALTGDDDNDAGAGAATGSSIEQTTGATEPDATATATATATTTATAAAPAPGGPGTVVVGDQDALAPGAELSGSAGEPVTGTEVTVASVVADEAFYVGPEAGQTILVRLQQFGGTDAPESPFQVEAGDTVSFSGTLEQVDQDFLDDLQLYDPSTQYSLGDFYVQAGETTLAP